ncbi:putative bifunctional diguanylate cyclase/phosphodiesterase [Colwellia sp. MT41]|uniref:putative bifunctional diguanylate cyclase/phosphodiesterase n=1 Tax=Colwellia sp. MT41 TaxID=58049 RepID=UPI000A45D1B2|nr:EAL domain-containing protein [Colwellia sp. MT41]
MANIKTGTWKANALFMSVFLLLTYILLLASMAKNSANVVNQNGFITVDKAELVTLGNLDKLITTVLLNPQSYLYQDEIFIISGQQHTQVNIHSFEEHILASFIDMAIPFAALFIIALTTVVINAWYYRNKVSKEIAPLCRKVDRIINSYNLTSDSHQSAADLNALNHSLDFLQQISNEYQIKAEQHSFCDKLTKLVDRYHFLDHINKQLILTNETGTKSGLLFIDLDGFKSVNDSYGHSFGDEVLIQVAERLRSIVRRKNLSFKQDDNALEYNLSRLGGDEFTLFIKDLEDPEHAISVAIDILQELERDFILGNKTIKISASIGIAIYPDSAATPYALIQMADVAMYRAKTEGRGVYRIYSAEMGAKLRRYHYLLDEMRQAIDSTNFFLTYQPVIDIDDFGISYFEALVRWQHPVEGTIAPDEFIPIAEDSNLILDLGDWILDEACRQMAAWYNAGMKKVRISVNVSPIQLKHKSLYDWIIKSLAKSGLPPHSLMLEITESCFIEASDELFNELEKLRADGVMIAIDDFGTGFSSLSVLAHLPVDVLKIDKLFVAEAIHNIKYKKILHSIVDMALKLELKVVAEGIENKEQLELLKTLGVKHIQGYLISRPQRSNYVGEKIFEQGINHMAQTGTSRWPPQINEA